MRITWETKLDLLDDEAKDRLNEMRAKGADTVLTRTEWRRLDLIPPDEWVEL